MGLLLKLSMLLMGGIFVAEIGVLAAARLDYRDPFAPYAAIMPGQSADALKDYCQLHAGVRNGLESGYCDFDAEDGVFGRITAIETNHLVTILAFVALPNRLHLGDLVLCWGKPNTVTQVFPSSTLSLNVYWRSQMRARITPVRYGAQMDYFLPIDTLSIDEPCGSPE